MFGQVVTYTDMSEFMRKDRADVGARPVMLDQTRPVAFLLLGNLTGCDLTIVNCRDQRVWAWRGISAFACAMTQIGASSPRDGASSLNLTHGAG